MPLYSWPVPGRKPGHVHEGDDRHVEGVAGPHEPRRLLGGVDVEAAGELGRLVGDDADAAAVDAAEPDDDVHGALGLHLEELVVVEQAADHLVHVVGLVGRVRDQRVEFEILRGERLLDRPLDRVGRGVAGRLAAVVAGQVGQHLLDPVEGVLLAGGDVVRHAGFHHVGVGAAEVLHGDVLAGDGLDDVRAGDEHLAGLIDHDDEIGERGGVHVATGCGTHDQRDLRDHAGGGDVALEYLAVEAERDDTLLDAGAGALVDADQRAAGLHREVHHLDDLLAVHLAEAATENRDVLAEDADLAAVDGAVAGDDAVA